MFRHGHLPGSEIFTVGAYMRQYLSVDDPAHAFLPQAVRQILRGNLTWTFENEGDVTSYPMKYMWASDLHEDIQPYQFPVSPISATRATIVKFGIIYGVNAGSRQRIFINPQT
ncbi:hypothetical protein Fcan01_27423 [Folsomia candida]|uniref:Uncharacterized protein n=1 Tax=Folsomia candida TaxID=158441 RepID=A0A226CYZ4_FOLCA|nr:hypothetical protein Fcan01_27423 [Folsomia candida]